MNFEKFGQTPKKVNLDPKSILRELVRVDQLKRGQKYKGSEDEYKELDKEDLWDIDKVNIEKLKNVVSENGWNFIFSDKENFINTWILIQHADFDTEVQEEFLKESLKRKDNFRIKLKDNEVKVIESNLVMLEDRILNNKFSVQKYGSQWSIKNGRYFLIPVLKDENIDIFDNSDNEKNFEVFDLNDLEDIKEINERRLGVGMIALQEYAKKNKEWMGSGYSWIESK